MSISTFLFPTDHNANAWKEVLLAALADIAPDGGEVRQPDVLAWCERQDDFPQDGWAAWGFTDKRGKPYPRARRAITLAAGKLKEEGIIRCPRRNYYALSGPVEAPVAASDSGYAPMPLETPVEPVEPVEAPVAAPIVNVVTKDGVVFTPASNAVNSAAYEAADAGLRRMAATQTRCFGAWSSRSSQCGKCPIAGMCQQAGMADFAEVAARLDTKTEERLERDRAQGEVEESSTSGSESVADEVAIPVGTQVDHSRLDGNAKVMAVPFGCPCHGCGEMLQTGQTGVYRHVSAGGGVFHPQCYPSSGE